MTKREELQRLRTQIDELSLQYIRNLDGDKSFLLFSEMELVGLPSEFLKVIFFFIYPVLLDLCLDVNVLVLDQKFDSSLSFMIRALFLDQQVSMIQKKVKEHTSLNLCKISL